MKVEELILLKNNVLLSYLHKELKGELSQEYLYVENKKSPLLLQAHIDTVRRELPSKFYIKNGIIKANNILGADDRAGVFSILKIKERIQGKAEIPNLLLTDGEELMGMGMEIFLEEKKDFSHINLALALDRQGCGEYVAYNYLPKKVQEYVSSFGFTKREGSFSDIELFTEETLIPSVNLSVGYYYQHTKAEELHLDEMYLTINRVVKMIQNPIKKKYKSKKTDRMLWNSWRRGGGLTFTNKTTSHWGDSCTDKDPSYVDYEDACEICGSGKDVGWIKDSADDLICVCGNCTKYFDMDTSFNKS